MSYMELVVLRSPHASRSVCNRKTNTIYVQPNELDTDYIKFTLRPSLWIKAFEGKFPSNLSCPPHSNHHLPLPATEESPISCLFNILEQASNEINPILPLSCSLFLIPSLAEAPRCRHITELFHPTPQ